MKRTAISTEDAPKAIGPYSQAVAANGFLFTAGQIPLDPATGAMVGDGNVRLETDRVMQNLAAVLAAKGLGFDAVVKTTIFLVDLADFAVVNEVYGNYVGTEAPPARSTVAVAALPRGARVEIEMVAALPD